MESKNVEIDKNNQESSSFTQQWRKRVGKFVWGIERPIAGWLQRLGIVKKVQNWGRAYSPWPLQYGIGCCMTEGAAVMGNRWDIERLGLLPLFGPRQSDVLMISGAVNKKMLPRLMRIYEQMPDPKYVICFGACAMSGGAFWDNYSLVHPISDYVPVDVFVPGCPPKPEDLVRGFMMLEEKIRKGDTFWDKTYRK